MEIQKIHNFILDYLLEKKQERFALRPKNERDKEMLNKGFWFPCAVDGDLIVISFCNSIDSFRKEPNIYLQLHTTDIFGGCYLRLIDYEESERSQFFKQIAPILNLTASPRNQGQVHWYKIYEYNPKQDIISYITEVLEVFLIRDKPIIDTFIRAGNKLSLFPAIPKKAFEENLNYILELRQKQGNRLVVSATIPKTLYLTGMALENISHFKYIKMDLKHQVTCIIGENGSGKSSILRALALGLAGIKGNTVIDIRNPVLQKLLRIQKVEINKEIYAPNGKITVYYSGDKNCISYENNRDEIVDSRGRIWRNFNQISDTGSHLTATNGNYFKNLVLGFSQIKSLSDNKSDFQTDDVKPRISEVTNLIYNLPDDAFDNFTTWIIQLWSAKMTYKLREVSLQVLIDIFAVIQRIVGGMFELMPMKTEQTNIFIKTTDAPEGIPLQLISQGYSNVIGWVGHFMRRLWEVTANLDKVNFKKTPAICLIDEIDTYLHPKWEQKILAVLAEEFPNTQFVVTTHSPIVLANLKDNYRIYTIAKADNGQMMAFEHQKSVFNPYGASSSEVIRRLMHVQERPEPVQKLMDAYNQAIIHNDFAKAAEFETKLKQLIDPNDPEIIEGQASIEARKIIQDL